LRFTVNPVFRGHLWNKETVVFEKEKCDLFNTGDNLINMSDYCLTPNKQFFSRIMERTSYDDDICPLCFRPTR
jgi:hypothetical protein